MPCTLQPWEVEYEEKEANKLTFRRKLTDAALLEEVACSACRILETYMGRGMRNAPPLVRKWWKLHKQKDARKK